MKKTLSVLVVLLSFSSLVFATKYPGAEPGMVIIKSGTTYKLYYSGTKQTNVTISIRDARDRIVYTEVLKNVSGFVRPYNFSHLEEGKYTMEIKDSNGLLTEEIRYGKTRESTFARVIRLLDNEQKYLLMFSCKTPTSIRVKIYDESDNVIYSKEEVTQILQYITCKNMMEQVGLRLPMVMV
jgi:hypothetical protein